MAAFQPGNVLLGKYLIDKLIRQGAFGEVYKARHKTLNATRAITVFRQYRPGISRKEYKEFQARFVTESQIMDQLNQPIPNPHLLKVHDLVAGKISVCWKLNMPPGGNLNEKIQHAREQRHPIPAEESISITLDLSLGLTALHEHGIIHHDLKPSNCLFDEKGLARVGDLGLALILQGPSQRSKYGQPKQHPGTSGYMKPEQQTTNFLIDGTALALLKKNLCSIL